MSNWYWSLRQHDWDPAGYPVPYHLPGAHLRAQCRSMIPKGALTPASPMTSPSITTFAFSHQHSQLGPLITSFSHAMLPLVYLCYSYGCSTITPWPPVDLMVWLPPGSSSTHPGSMWCPCLHRPLLPRHPTLFHDCPLHLWHWSQPQPQSPLSIPTSHGRCAYLQDTEDKEEPYARGGVCTQKQGWCSSNPDA